MFAWRQGCVSGLAKHMDIVLLSGECILYNRSLEEAKTIFVNTRLKEKLILHFIDHILPRLVSPVCLILAGEDYTFPNNMDKRMSGSKSRLQEFKTLGQHKMIRVMFVENLDEQLENVWPLPLGINPNECPVTLDYFLPFEQIDGNKPLRITNFNRTRDGQGQWAERGHVHQLCTHKWKSFVVPCQPTNHRDYLSTMARSMFTVCVHGGGLDVNPKLWEALLVGVIPIIRENKPYTDLYKRLDLPVVIVPSWESIQEQDLQVWQQTYYPCFTHPEKRKQMIHRLTLDFWVHHVQNECTYRNISM